MLEDSITVDEIVDTTVIPATYSDGVDDCDEDYFTEDEEIDFVDYE